MVPTVILFACLYLIAPFCVHGFDWVWRQGRSTYYGLDSWSISKGSCNYGQFGLYEASTPSSAPSVPPADLSQLA